MTLDATVRWLAKLQHPTGSWTDFLLAPGPSDAWVTAYTGTALALAASSDRLGPRGRALAARHADAAARWLLGCLQAPPLPSKWAFNYHHSGWGWCGGVRPDADSTAWAVRLLALRGRPVPPSALSFLAAHRCDGGYRTYRDARVSGAWAEPAPEVTAAVLLARHAAGELSPAGLADEWRSLLEPARGADDAWHSMWWPDPAYPSAVVGAAWVAAGRPTDGDDVTFPQSIRHDVTSSPNVGRPPAREEADAWGLATALWVAAAFEPDGCAELAAALLAARRADGGWPGTAVLRVPPQRTTRAPSWTRDARGVFTTATALHALLAVPGHAVPVHELDTSGVQARSKPDGVEFTERRHRTDRHGTERGHRTERRQAAAREACDELVGGMAAAAGVNTAAALAAFRALTRESLARDGVWPAPQLSNLAGGTPLEFSVGAAPALRLTTEVGDPLLPPHARVRSGLRAVARAAALLGTKPGWHAVQPAIATLTDPELPVPDGCRFWLWAGLDIATSGKPVLKAYLSLHGQDVPGWPGRESSFLTACGVPDDAPVHAVLAHLRKHGGWCHEIGVGLTGDHRLAGVKVYYELAGYRPSAVAGVLAMCGLDPDPAGLAPEVPGVLRASLAAKRRSGIAVRVHPSTGRVDEVTVAAAFPVPLVGRAAIADRVSAWLSSTGGPHATERAHDRAVAVLQPGWRDAPAQAKLHSLLTRSRSARGDETKIYLRPWLGHQDFGA